MVNLVLTPVQLFARRPANSVERPTPADLHQLDEGARTLRLLGLQRLAQHVEVDRPGDGAVNAAQGLGEDGGAALGGERGRGAADRHGMMPGERVRGPRGEELRELRAAVRAKSPTSAGEHARVPAASHVWVRRRALGALAAAGWWATALALLLWWAPAILLKVTGLLLGRFRFRAALLLGQALAGVGFTDAARAIFAHVRRRAGRRVRELRARRGW